MKDITSKMTIQRVSSLFRAIYYNFREANAKRIADALQRLGSLSGSDLLAILDERKGKKSMRTMSVSSHKVACTEKDNSRCFHTLKRKRGGGARLRRPSRERTRTMWAWTAQEMQ